MIKSNFYRDKTLYKALHEKINSFQDTIYDMKERNMIYDEAEKEMVNDANKTVEKKLNDILKDYKEYTLQ